jgi:hypothetical protein
LPRGEREARLDDAIAREGRAAIRKRRENADSQRAASRAELHDVAAARFLEQVRDAIREAGGKERRELRCRHEVAGGAEDRLLHHVVTEPGLIQRGPHEFCEGEPSTLHRDARTDARRQLRRSRGLRRFERRRRTCR